MSDFKETWQSQSYEYKCDDMFPEYKSNMPDLTVREYVKNKMVKLANDGKLSVTDIHNQNKRCCEWAGKVILGQSIDPDSRSPLTGITVPHELRDYKVKIKSIKWPAIHDAEGKEIAPEKHDPIEWNLGFERMTSTDPQGYVTETPRSEMRRMTSNLKEADVNLEDAWRILHSHGKNCKVARSGRLQRRFWKYEEIKPTAKRVSK